MTDLDPAIVEHALAEYPRECCGVLLERDGRRWYRPCRNVAEKPEDHFAIADADMRCVHDEGEVVGIVHSHPDATSEPSPRDVVQCRLSEVPWTIVGLVHGREVSDWRVITPEPVPYVGRPFVHGIQDCWSLCRDWYVHEQNLTDMPDPPRADEWWDDGTSDLYRNNLAAAGFTHRVADWADMIPGDLILMQIRSRNQVPNHAAVYVGDGKMLHHMYGRLSRVELFGGYWQHNTVSVWRHRSRAL